MEPLALPSSSPNSSGHHLHRPLLHSSWGFQTGSPAPGQDLESGSSYEASVVATSLLPPGDAWAHHPMLATPAPAQQHWIKQEPEEHGVNGGAHDDSGISPGRTSSSGPSSSGGSPPAASNNNNINNTNRTAAPSSPASKPEQQDGDDDCRSSPVTHDDEDSSEMSEDTMDSLSRLQMALSQSGSPLGDIYNGSEDQPSSVQCPLCAHISLSLPALAAHLSSHVEQKSDTSDIQCPDCSFSTGSKEEFVSHLSSHFTSSDSPALKPRSSRRCSVCDFTTKSASKLRSHLADVHGFAPGENDIDDDDATTPRVNSQGKVKTFRCKQCNFVAVTKMDFWAHSRVHIKGEKMLSCPRCPFVTEYKHHLEYHLRNHSGSKPFKCSQCSYSCVNKSMLNSHLKSHSNVYQYRCVDCNYATKYCHSLKLHLRKYSHAPAMVLNPDGTPNPLPIIDVYGTRRGPKAKKDPSQDLQNSKQDKTPQLSQVFPSEVMEDPYKCAQCDFSTPSQEHFAQHLLAAHTNSNPKPRSPPILIPTPEKLLQQNHPIIIPQSNPMKDYLTWMYAQQQHAMDLYQQYKGSALPEPLLSLAPNPLDLSKEIKQKNEPTEIAMINNNNNDIIPTPPISSNKNRRKGKAFKLERIAVQQDEDVDEDVQPPPSKVRNVNSEVRKESSVTPPPAQYLSPKSTLQSPQAISSKGVSETCSEEVKSPVICTSPTLALNQSDAQPTYNCGYCDILFKDVVMYTMHMGYHGYKDPFHCNMCGQQTSDKLSFFLHIARSSHS